MVNFIRRFQRPLLTVLVVIVIISFVVFFNMSNTRNGGFSHSDAVARLYGRTVNQLDVQKESHRFEVCFELRLPEMLFALAGQEAAYASFLGQQPSEAAVENYIWNTLVLRHEADDLGITATDTEKAEAIKALRPFQTNGAFDFSKYDNYTKLRLSHRGLTPADVEQLMADQIRLTKVRALLATTIEPSPAEVREQYVERNQKTEVSFIRLKLEDFKAAVTVTDADVAKAFEERKAGLKTPEKRKVKLVAFTPDAGAKPLIGPERVRAMQAQIEKAQSFAIAMTAKDADFDAAAAKLGLPVKETPLFSAEEPPAELGKSEQAVEAAFKLTKAEPNSDVVDAQNGYFVLQLAGIEEARPLTLEEAKPKLAEQLKQERSQEAMSLKATESRARIEADLKAGKSFEEAAKTAGMTVEKLPAFAATDARPTGKPEEPDAQEIKSRAADMKEGELSEFVPTATGGLVVHLDKRLPIDEAAFAKEKASVAEGLGRMKGEAIFQDWLRERRAAAKLEPLGRS